MAPCIHISWTLAALCLSLGCGVALGDNPDVVTPAFKPDAGSVPPPLCPTLAPVHHLKGERADGTPLRLPTQRTWEPCDGIDNDDDGITDPHCGNVACLTDADCTYGGVVPDADCNPFQGLDPGFDRPGCNQIDGYTEKARTYLNDCWGVLCPAGQKCVAGDCVAPGSLPPCAHCTDGAQCPANSGCIPIVVDVPTNDRENPVCITYCHVTPCPAGFECTTWRMEVDGHPSWRRICAPEGQDRCSTTRDMPGSFQAQGPDICE